MRLRTVVFFLLLAGCTPDPAELTVSLVEPAAATAQYFHGNCFAGFGLRVDLRVQETRRISLVISRFAFRLTDRGTGLLLADETLDTEAFDLRYGDRASFIPAGATKLVPITSVSAGPVGPLAVAGEIEGMDENNERVVESFDLSAPLAVNDPGAPSGGACTTP